MRNAQKAAHSTRLLARRFLQGIVVIWLMIGAWLNFTLVRDWRSGSEIVISGNLATDQEVLSLLTVTIGITLFGGIIFLFGVRQLTKSIEDLQRIDGHS